MKYRTRTPNVPPYHWLYTTLLNHCKNDEKQCQLTFNDFLKFVAISKCHYCNADVVWSKCSRRRDENGKLVRNSSSFNLDRKDNNNGYSIKNCVVCCPRCNSIKGETLNYDEMLLLREGLCKIANIHVTQ